VEADAMMDTETITSLIRDALPEADIDVRSDDGVHFAALVVARDFEGLSRIRRHQLVYGALGERMGGEIHALALRTLTPEEASQQAG
jgi:acid stress-induced BolA-like protein IbaG/YrbA